MSSDERRRAQRALAGRLARDFGLTFDFALRAVRAAAQGRRSELGRVFGECRHLGFIAAVQAIGSAS